MARIEYKAECLCGGEILTTFKKPTRLQHSVARANCKGCGSKFSFKFSIEYANGKRAYVPEHEVDLATPKLKKLAKAKRDEQLGVK